MAVVNGTWVLDLFDKQMQLLRMCREKNGLRKYIFAAGSRWAGKSVACLNAICDHCWHTKHANVAIIVPSITVGSDSGIWTELTERIIPEWIEGKFGFDWAPKGKPHQMGQTKKMVCAIKNKHGGVSKIELNSLKDERDVERDFKGRYFTMVYISEATFVEKRHSYLTLIQCLRVKGVPEEEYVLLADGNPSDQGEDSFWYKEWFVFRIQNPSLIPEEERPRQKYLKLIEFFPDDNIFLSEEFKLQKKAEFSSDPDLFARYWLGLWKKASTGAIFAAHFKPALHVIDESEEGHDLVLPQPGCMELMTSWDFGPVNPAVVFCEKFFHAFGEEERAVFKFFDEIIFFGVEDMSLGDFTELVTEKMDFYEQLIGHQVHWTHYSDRSVFDIRESIANIFQYQEVYLKSNKRIELIGVHKGPGTVPQGIRLWRKLLLQQRLLFSAKNCPKLIEMNQSLKSGPHTPIAKGQVHTHPFDAARYLVTRECWTELMDNIITLRNADREPDKITAIPL